MRFLLNPYDVWKNGAFPVQHTVLKLAFSERRRYYGEGGVRTPDIALPFKASGSFFRGQKEMARLDGESLHALFEELADWNHQLEHVDGLKEALAALDDKPDISGDLDALAAASSNDKVAP